MQIVTDKDYRSHAVPCYPFEDEQKERYIKELESRVVLAICDRDYRLPPKFGDIRLPVRISVPSELQQVA
jgi:hypothetical protein